MPRNELSDPIITWRESNTSCGSRKLDKREGFAQHRKKQFDIPSFFGSGQRGKVGTFRSCSEANCSCSWYRAFPGERVDFTDKSLINRIICTRIVVPGQPQHVVIHQTDSLLAQRWNYALWTILRSIEALGNWVTCLFHLSRGTNRSNIDVCRLKLNLMFQF